MTTIVITRDSKKHRWLATSDTPSLPKILRTVPVYPDGEDSMGQEAVEAVRKCNPGCRVELGMGTNSKKYS